MDGGKLSGGFQGSVFSTTKFHIWGCYCREVLEEIVDGSVSKVLIEVIGGEMH